MTPPATPDPDRDTALLTELARRGRRTLPDAPERPVQVFVVGRGISATAEAYIEDVRVSDNAAHLRLLLDDGAPAEAVVSLTRALELGLAPEQIAPVRFEQR